MLECMYVRTNVSMFIMFLGVYVWMVGSLYVFMWVGKIGSVRKRLMLCIGMIQSKDGCDDECVYVCVICVGI